MLAKAGLSAQEALVCTMVMVAAADGGMTDREIGVMSGLVQTMPAFRGFTSERLDAAMNMAISLLRDENGLKRGSEMLRTALDPKLRETAYALACDVAAADHFAKPEEMRMLEWVVAEFEIEPLVVAAIECAARARHRTA